MPRENFDNLITPGAIGDPSSIVYRQGGVMIDWANVPDNTKNANGDKTVKAFTPVSESPSLGEGNVVLRSAPANPAVGLLATNAVENDPSAAKTGYGLITGGQMIESRLPVELDADVKAELNAAGTGFGWQNASNSLSD